MFNFFFRCALCQPGAPTAMRGCKVEQKCQLDCVKWKVLPRMFPNKTLFPQILLLNPTLAAVSCPNAAPKVLILIIDTYQNIAEIMCISSPHLSPPAIPALLFLD